MLRNETPTLICAALFLAVFTACTKRAPEDSGPRTITREPLRLTLERISVTAFFEEDLTQDVRIDVWCFLERTDGEPISGEDNVTLGGASLLTTDGVRIPSSSRAQTRYVSGSVPWQYGWVGQKAPSFADGAGLLHYACLVKKGDLAGLTTVGVEVRLGMTERDAKPMPFLFKGVRLPLQTPAPAGAS